MSHGYFIFLIVNFNFDGIEWSKYKDGIVRDKIVVLINERDYEFKKINVPPKEISTCTITVHGEHNEKEIIIGEVSALCDLLCIANGTFVDFTKWSYYENDKVIDYRGKGSIVSLMKPGRRLISNLPPEDLKIFLESTFARYIELRPELQLNVIISYFVKMRTDEFVQIRCLMGFVLLECLADNARKYFDKIGAPIINESISRRTREIKKILKIKNVNMDNEIISEIANEMANPNPSLSTSISKLKNHFGVVPESDDENIYGWRREYIHQGISSSASHEDEYSKRYLVLMNLIDRIILKIIGYNGYYCDVRRIGARTLLTTK